LKKRWERSSSPHPTQNDLIFCTRHPTQNDLISRTGGSMYQIIHASCKWAWMNILICNRAGTENLFPWKSTH
jgi:hypothetical protein